MKMPNELFVLVKPLNIISKHAQIFSLHFYQNVLPYARLF